MSILAASVNLSNSLFSSIDRAVDALHRELVALNYNAVSIEAVLKHAHAEGDLAGLVEAGWLEAEDLDHLTETFASAFDPVHPSSPQWLDRGTWEPTIPTDEDAQAYAAMIGEFDADDVPPSEPADAWDDRAYLDALHDTRQPPAWVEHENAELTEVGLIPSRLI